MTDHPHPHRPDAGPASACLAGAAAAFDRGRLVRATAPRRWSVQSWLQALLLAVAPLLVVGFYGVVEGTVERAEMRRLAPPPGHAQPAADRLRQVIWECTMPPGGGLHSDCRPLPAGAVRTTTAGG